MRRFEFNHDNKQWDQLKCFHYPSSGFTEYETGEVIVTNPSSDNRWDSKARPNKFGIELTTSRDCALDLFTDSKCTQKVKRAWLLQYGQQEMAVDYEQKVVVRLNGCYSGYGHTQPRFNNKARHLPSQYRHAQAFWPRHGELPVPLKHFVVSRPDRTIKKTLADKLKLVRPVIMANIRINPPSQKSYYGRNAFENQDRYRANPKWVDTPVGDIVAEILALANHSGDVDRYSIAHNGFSYPRADETCDFLYIK